MLREIRPALSLVVLMTIALGMVVPGIFTKLSQAVFPFQAGGSLIVEKGQPVASAIIGQTFTGPSWFNSRPSALMGTDAKGNAIATPYDDSESGASNLAPTSAALLKNIQTRIAAWQKTYGGGAVPADAVTTSGSGVDPDISLDNAMAQAPVVAAARHLPPGQVVDLVSRLAYRPAFGIIGTSNVNVVQLNLALLQMH